MPLRLGSTSPGRNALPEMLFSAAGISTRSRIGSLVRMTSSAKASAEAAPPMSFFISAMALPGLMSRPPVSKQMPLPTMVTLGACSAPKRRSMRRGAAVARAPDRVDHREIVGEQARALGDLDASAISGGELARGGLKLGGAKIVGRRVDEIAAEIERLGERQNLLLARAFGKDETLRLGVVRGLVAREAVASGEEAERGKLRVRQGPRRSDSRPAAERREASL